MAILLDPPGATEVAPGRSAAFSRRAAHARELGRQVAVAFQLLVDALEEIGAGHPVSLIQVDREIGTQEAADLLNVSRPYVVKLLDEQRAIPFRKVGRERRVRLSDLLAYKRADDARRDAVADELAREGQALGLGY